MEGGQLGQDDFGISPKALQSFAEAMTKVSAESAKSHSDIWRQVKEMLEHTAAYADEAGTEEDAVAVYRFRALVNAALLRNDEQAPKLKQHPKHADLLLIQCWVPAFGDTWQRCLRWAYTLATELSYARKYLAILVWLLSRLPGKTRESSWAKLSYDWVVRAEKAMLEELQNRVTAN